MSFEITKNTGNGKLAQSGLLSYSYSEEVTSLEPSSSNGGTGQVSFGGIATDTQTAGYDASNSKLMINNTMRLNDSSRGEIEFQVKKLSTAGGAVTVTGDTVQSRLNVEKTAAPLMAATGSSVGDVLFSKDFSSETPRVLATNASEYYLYNSDLDYIYTSTVADGLMTYSIDNNSPLANSFTITCTTEQTNLGRNNFEFSQVSFDSTDTISLDGFDFRFDVKSNHPGTYVIVFWQWNNNGFIMREFDVSGSGDWEHIVLNVPPYTTGTPDTSLYIEMRLGADAFTGTYVDQWTEYEYGVFDGYPNISSLNSILGNSISFANFQITKSFASETSNADTLYTAIQYYCSLVGITPVFDGTLATDLANIPVNFLGWTGNVWEKLKQLCAVASTSLSDRVGIEMYVNLNELHFRQAVNRNTDFVSQNNLLDLSVSVDSFDAAKEIVVYNYNTEYGANRVIFESSNYDENGKKPDGFKASITDSMQVNSGETIVKRFQINAHLTSVNQPVNVDTISSIPYHGSSGEYVIVDSNNVLVTASEWAGRNGVLSVSLTENPDEIEVKIVAPESLINPDGSIQKESYKIGVKSDGEVDYPAFWITGTGVFFEKKKHTFKTGASDSLTSRDSATSIDNQFITTPFMVANAGLSAAQKACGPSVVISASGPDLGSFGEAIGWMQYAYDNRFRIESASFSADSTSISGSAHPTISDFDSKWTSATFDDFNTIVLNGINNPDEALKFNEFTVIPLMETQ